MNFGVVDGLTREVAEGVTSGWEQVAAIGLSGPAAAVRFAGLAEFRELRLTARPIVTATNYMLWRANGDSASTYNGIGFYASNNPSSGNVNTLGAVGYLTHQPLAANLVHASWLNDDPSRYRPCLWSAMQTRVVGVVTYWSSGGSDWQSTGQPIDTIDLYMASGTFTNGSWFRMEGRR